MSNPIQHVPAHTSDELRSMKKKEAVVAYETEVQYFAGMGDVMPELDDEHRTDVELAVADMEQQQVSDAGSVPLRCSQTLGLVGSRGGDPGNARTAG